VFSAPYVTVIATFRAEKSAVSALTKMKIISRRVASRKAGHTAPRTLQNG